MYNPFETILVYERFCTNSYMFKCQLFDQIIISNIFLKKDFEDYRIGVVTGVRGEPVNILEESFSSEEACEHAIFLKRIVDLLDRYSEWLIRLWGLNVKNYWL